MKSVIDQLGKLERQITRLSLQAILMGLGPKAAGGYLSYSPVVRRTQARILWLHELIRTRHGQEAADRFALGYLSARPRLQDYSIALVGTGTHRPSSERLAAAMPKLIAAARQQEDATIALIAALLERGDMDLALEVIAAQKDRAPGDSTVDWPQLLLSLAPRHLYETISSSTGITASEHLHPGPCKNRLIIMDDELSPAAIKSLAAGAEKITLLQYKDLYGRIDLKAVQAEIPGCEIVVEHGRSRVDRFHQRYYDMHRKTLEAAEALSQSFIQNTPWLAELVPGLHDFDKDLTLELSDKLFFKTLRLEGVLQAALDPAFDSVIVTFGDGFELLRLFYSDPILWQDARIQGCCRPRKVKTVVKHAARVSDMQRRASVGSGAFILERIAALEEDMPADARLRPPENVKGYLLGASKIPERNVTSHVPDRKNVAFVVQEGRAYGYTAVQMATHLHSRYNVDVILTMGSISSLLKNLSAAQKDPFLPKSEKGRLPGYMKLAAAAPDKSSAHSFSDAYLVSVADAARDLMSRNHFDRAVHSAIDFMLTDGLPQAVLHTIANARAIAALFEQRQYSAVAISPIRTPRNAQFTTLAREAGIPSLAVEPHCLNAAYCRYGTVLSDYAAVYSDYYAQEYDRYFGIPKERCYPFGSPRVLRPMDYDPIAARKEARRKIGLHPGDPPIIAVPTQPMPADHILAVWRMIIRAAKAFEMPVRVILKAHPEEGPGHVGRYRQIIAEEGATDLCYVAEVDIKDLLIASELVLTAYSVTALEAVVLERNVAIVGREGVTYPVEYDKILGIPLCVTEKETLDTIREALTLHRDAKSGAQQFKAANPHLFDNSTFDRLETVVEDIIARGSGGIRSHEELPSSLFVTAPFQEYLV